MHEVFKFDTIQPPAPTHPKVIIYTCITKQKSPDKPHHPLHTQSAQEIGYSPSTSLDAGVAHFVEWFRRYYGPEVMAGRETPADWVRRGLCVLERGRGMCAMFSVCCGACVVRCGRRVVCDVCVVRWL